MQLVAVGGPTLSLSAQPHVNSRLILGSGLSGSDTDGSATTIIPPLNLKLNPTAVALPFSVIDDHIQSEQQQTGPFPAASY